MKGRAEGREEGIEIGAAKKEAEMIEKMRLAGFTDEEINRIHNV